LFSLRNNEGILPQTRIDILFRNYLDCFLTWNWWTFANKRPELHDNSGDCGDDGQ